MSASHLMNLAKEISAKSYTGDHFNHVRQISITAAEMIDERDRHIAELRACVRDLAKAGARLRSRIDLSCMVGSESRAMAEHWDHVVASMNKDEGRDQ